MTPRSAVTATARATAARSQGGAKAVDSLGFLTADVLRLLRADFTARTRDIPLTPALHRLLFYVKREPGCRQVELAHWLDVTPVTVGRMIDRLERQGLVRRENEPGDRRVSRVYIAAGATGLLEQLNDRAQETRERAVRGMSVAERKALLTALEKLRQNLLTDAPTGATRRRSSRVR
jgi:DNA-binding MarR family transcriptional regulator